MTSKIWARLLGGVVAELQAFDSALVPGTDVPALWTDDVTAVASIAIGWVKQSDGSFAAPIVPAPTTADLIAYAAASRYAKETGGITVAGSKIDTSRGSQGLITGAWATVQLLPAATFQWKNGDNSWSALTASQVTAVAQAVSAHVQTCFATEQSCDAAIRAVPPTITTLAEIDAAFAALSA